MMAIAMLAVSCPSASASSADEGGQNGSSTQRRVVAQVADSIWRSSFPGPMITAISPRVSIARETRPVLTRHPSKMRNGDLLHGRIVLDLTEGSRVEFALGVVASPAAAPTKDPPHPSNVNEKGDDQPVPAETEPPSLTTRAQAEVWILSEAGPRRVWSKTLPDKGSPWQTQRVDLPAGPKQTLEFRIASGEGMGNARFGDPVVSSPASEAPAIRGVILISLDTLRADRTSVYGYKRQTTPRLEELFGQGGTVFENVYTQGPDTVLGHIAMLKGRTGASTLLEPGVGMKQSRAFASLADVLRHNGYRTAAYTENGMLIGNNGFNQGFEVWFENTDVEQRPEKGHIKRTFAMGMDWFRQHQEEPFFLFLHSYQVHSPYGAPAPWSDLFPSAANADSVARDSDSYDEGIAYADAQTAAFLEQIDALGFGDDILVVVTSDHGEEFAEHGRLQHGANLTQENLLVPLLMRGPGVSAGKRVDRGPSALMDVAPTILDYLGIAAPESFQGVSLRNPDALAPSGERIIPHEAWLKLVFTPDGFDPSFVAPSFAVTRGSMRLVRVRHDTGHHFEMYDLGNDPGEKHDLVAAGSEVPKDLKRRLRNYLENQIGLHYQAVRKLQKNSAATKPAKPQETTEDAERNEKLKALGYISD
ncbi:MAG: arylsulfatase A-like enzyme [Hyphomicrobiaceae bacterium]|jgi:arylsulfatase A-like enzyme